MIRMQLDSNGPVPTAELAAAMIPRPAAARATLDGLAPCALGAPGRHAGAGPSADGAAVAGEAPTG